MNTHFTKSGTLWVETASGEILTDEDMVDVLAHLPDGARLRVSAHDEPLEDEDDGSETGLEAGLGADPEVRDPWPNPGVLTGRRR